MKITATRKEDILKRKEEYDTEWERLKNQHDEEQHRYRVAELEAMQPVEDYLNDKLSKFDKLHFDIQCNPTFLTRGKGIEVRIRCDENQKFDDSSSLSWSYEARLDENGDPVRETSSWSGLKAVTEEQLDNLEQSLSALRYLSTVDWSKLLDVTMPEFRDYIKTEVPSRSERPNFEKELNEAELEEIIGQPKMIEVQAFPSSWYTGNNSYNKRGTSFIAIVKDSGSQYTIIECPKRAVDNGEVYKYFTQGEPHRVKKDQLKPVQPINIIDVTPEKAE